MKLKLIFAAVAAVFALVSCESGGNEYHSTYFYPMDSGIMTYADQTYDSVKVVSTDSWTLDNNSEWCTIRNNGQVAPFSVNIPAGYIAATRLDLALLPNNTGAIRSNTIEVQSSYAKIGKVMQTLVQMPFLNISSPTPMKQTVNENTQYTFTLTVPANGQAAGGKDPSISFTVYASGATLTTSDNSWLVPEQTSGFEKDKTQEVAVKVSANATGAERTGTLTLTSNGISTPITVKQAKQ